MSKNCLDSRNFIGHDLANIVLDSALLNLDVFSSIDFYIEKISTKNTRKLYSQESHVIISIILIAQDGGYDYIWELDWEDKVNNMDNKYKKSYKDIWVIEKEFNKSLLGDIRTSYWIVFMIGWMMSYILLPIWMYMWYFWDITTFIILWLPIVWVSLFLLFRRINKLIWTIIQNFFKRILDKISLLNNNIWTIDVIENILQKTREIYKIFITINTKKKLLLIAGRSETKKYFVDYSNIILKYLIVILTDLRSDLQIRLTEQQKILESAKTEVTENIQWTSNLAQVSELQKVRLDKQIEQFGELQRVLVRE